jgi:hypothetical protein
MGAFKRVVTVTLPEKGTTKSAILSELDAQYEIQKFVEAVRSYPAHFACNPEITFEVHLMRISGETGNAPAEQGT